MREGVSRMKAHLFDNWNTEKVIAGYTADFDGSFHYHRDEDIPHYEAVGRTCGIATDHMVRVHQYHTDHVLAVDEDNGGEGILREGSEKGNDAMVTDRPGLMLCAIAADCVPILLYDEKKDAIGLAHSGRIGTAKEIAFLTVCKMQQLYGTDPKNVQCILGPHLCAHHHDVSDAELLEFSERFTAREREKFVCYSGGQAYVDMASAIKISLVRAGLREENIWNCGICTYEHPDLFSWRRDPNPDRHLLAFIAMKGGTL